MVCDSARTNVTPALISIAMENIMRVFPMSKKGTGAMPSEGKKERDGAKGTGFKRNVMPKMSRGTCKQNV